MRGDHKANLSFVYSPFLGYAWSDDLRDEYTLVYETRQGTPFFWTPFLHGIGNTTVLGGPRRGKSLNTNALFTGAMKYGTKTFLFDQGYSYETNVHELGGSVMHLGLESPRINFFAVDHSRENVHAIAQTIRLMLSKTGEAVGNDDLDAIEKGVERMFDLPREVRQLRHLSLPPRLRKGLKRWLDGGIYGAIFDNVEDDMQFHDLQLFDFANLDEKHEDLLEVEMSWILYLCQNVIRDPKHLGTPKHLIIDELVGSGVGILPVIKFLLETIKADSKNLAWATLVTQSLEDLGPYAGWSLRTPAQTRCSWVERLTGNSIQKHFRLNERELEQVQSVGGTGTGGESGR